MRFVRLLFLGLVSFGATQAQTGPAPARMIPEKEVAPTYRLGLRDSISINIYDEPDLATAERIDGRGQVRLPLLPGPVSLAGKTVRDAEEFVRQAYIKEQLLKNPMVTLRVLEYAPKEVLITGQVSRPGAFNFPPEIDSMEIVDLISRLGGLTPLAKGKAVRVIRLGEDGKERVINVDVDNMMKRGRKESFLIYPGDRIFVDEVLF